MIEDSFQCRIEELNDIDNVRLDAKERLTEAQEAMRQIHDRKLAEKHPINVGEYVLMLDTSKNRAKLSAK